MRYFELGLGNSVEEDWETFDYSICIKGEREPLNFEEANEFIKEERTLNDFKVGLQVPGKLMPKTIRGGVLLVEDYYTMRRV